ncbi:MAG: 50S ribosomal protein L24 [Bryobacteraceae bacterium]|nr:50S ribosomal protein L24 [Bryobacteraceae bacterium]
MARPYRKVRKIDHKINIRKEDVVRVIAGRDRGKTGRVLSVDRDRGKALVEGINLIKRHTRPNPQKQIKGGIAERESPIHVSNLMLLASDGKPTRLSRKVETVAGKTRRVRIARRTGESLDKK